MKRVVFVLLVSVLTGLAFAQEQDEAAPELLKKADEIVKKLGDENYRERENATFELKNLVVEHPQLTPHLKKKGEQAKDPEIKHRLEMLWPLVKWDLTQDILKEFPSILAQLETSVAQVRARLAKQLGASKNPGAARLIVKLLADEHPDVREAAAKALRQKGKAVIELAVAEHARGLKKKGELTRTAAADALVRLGKPSVKPLIELLKDKDWDVRWRAAEALGELKAQEALDALTKALDDDDKDVRWAAVSALGEIGSKKAIETLIAALKNKNWDVRWLVAELMQEVGSRKAVPALTEALKDKEPLVRGSAAAALGEIKDKRPVGPLIEILKKDKDWSVRCFGAYALGKIGDEKALAPLIDALQDEDPRVCSDAAKALKKITGRDFGKDYEKWKEWHQKKEDK